MNNLDVLKNNRNALLLAEAVGWLHDYYKCSDENLLWQAYKDEKKDDEVCLKKLIIKNADRLEKSILFFPITETSSSKVDLLLHFFFWKSALSKALFGSSFSKPKTKKGNLLVNYLSRCHHAAHFDKQEPVDGKQLYPGTKISSPFGFERKVPADLTKKLWSLLWDDLKDYCPEKRKQLRQEVEALFSQVLADTRRPINEVDLWSWGLLVGSLYKSALAGALLTGSDKDAKKLNWRLLSVRVKGLEYMFGVSRIPDLLARKQLLENGLDRVQELLEVEYPLASEIYRDENGSIYVVPDLVNLLEVSDKSGTSLWALIVNEFRQGILKDDSELQIGGEIEPDIQLESEDWWGQDPEYNEKMLWKKHPKYGQPLEDKLPMICSILSSTPVSQPAPNLIKNFWQEKIADVCTVCGLRPQGSDEKSAECLVCETCEKRREDRSRDWATVCPEKTIWTGEVADANGRLALLVGQFDLTYWLDGTFLESIFVIAPQDPENTRGKDVTAKTPSPSRLRRIWETTRLFWQEVQRDTLAEAIGAECLRLEIYLDSKPKDIKNFHVYDLILGSTELNVVWVPAPDKKSGYLLSAANLSYIARRLGAEELQYCEQSEAARYVKDYIEKLFIQEKRTPVLYSPEHRASQKKQNLLEGRYITEVAYQKGKYAPVIPILAEPLTFMLFVPADKSLQMVHLIKKKYETEMAKVRGRLPLKLGVIYARYRMPIRSILDAAQAMLSRTFSLEIWQVKENGLKSASEETKVSTKRELLLERDKHAFSWCLPLQMGDKATDDCWYPYFFLASKEDEEDSSVVTRREAKAVLSLEHGKEKECKVVHAADLNPGEKIYLWPSIFDFEFLDTNARRFELYYNQEGRRPRVTKPFYLEDIDRFSVLWNEYLKHLSRTQCKQLVSTIEAVREQWFGQDEERLSLSDGVFFRLVADVLASAFWPQEKQWNSIPEHWREELVRAGVCGELTDLVELHLEILKE